MQGPEPPGCCASLKMTFVDTWVTGDGEGDQSSLEACRASCGLALRRQRGKGVNLGPRDLLWALKLVLASHKFANFGGACSLA